MPVPQNGTDAENQEPNPQTINAQDFGVFDDLEEQAKEATKEAQKDIEELREAYASIFSTQAGRKVLEDIYNRTLRKATWDPQKENPEAHGYYREGENSLAAYITKMINEGRTGEPSKPRQE